MPKIVSIKYRWMFLYNNISINLYLYHISIKSVEIYQLLLKECMFAWNRLI